MALLKSIFIGHCLVVLFICSILLNNHVIFAQSHTSFYHFCSENNNFPPNSTYKSNLVKLLSDLSTAARGGADSYRMKIRNTIYGSYFCRGGVSAAVCNDCVASAVSESATLCPVEKEAVIWYDECTLRYSNRSFFDKVEKSPGFYAWNVANATDLIEFRKKLESIMNDTAREVDNGAKRFLTKNITVDGFRAIYCLMQCSPDTSGADCMDCLSYAISLLSLCCSEKLGGRTLTPSCNVRYEVYPFYGSPDPMPLVPPPPPPPITRTVSPSHSAPITSEVSPSHSAPITSKVSPTPPPGKSQGISKGAIASILLAVVFVLVAFGVCHLLYRRRSRLKKYNVIERENGGTEWLQFDLLTIETATQNFSKGNKLGEGGFGEVYKGILPERQEIAVKRLSKSSGQGAQEFKNEVALVAKLQHRNLVRLLGFCLGGGETILVYEYVPNKSLDYFLFDLEKQGLLDWPVRCKIISGIARGILYLHEDSRLKVIHRDLKASNILLDADMNPKIADFGMAKMVGIDQTEGNTKRIVGTYGYMSPEYAMEGLYSIKSDVFSFGVLLLEILSGKKNSGFHLTKFAPSLLAYAWKLWKEGKCLDLMDQSLENSFQPNEFVRYVHIGLLCVQEDAYNRPTMPFVVLMLTTETITLPIPERPAFSVGKFVNNHNLQHSDDGIEISNNGLTISTLSPR